MSAIYFLIPITLIILALAVGLFFWAINSNQYSDLDKESSQILFEQKAPSKSKSKDSDHKTNKNKKEENEQ